MAGRRRQGTGRSSAALAAAAAAADSKTAAETLLRSPLMPMAALEEGAGPGGAPPLSASSPKPAPVDRYHLAYVIFYLQGVGQLFPWNAFITAGPYFSQRFCGTSHADDFENYFSLTFMLTNLVGQALCVRYAQEIARSCGSVTARITGSLALLLLVFLAIMLLVLFKDIPRDPLFGFTNLGVALAGACTSLLQAAIFGYAAVFPPRYTQAMMAGQGLAGLIVAVAGIATAASSEANPCESLARHEAAVAAGEEAADAAICSGYDRVDYHAFAYFGACVVILGLCMLSFLFLETMPLARYYTCKLTRPPEASPHSHAHAHLHSHNGAATTITIPSSSTAASAPGSDEDGEGAALVDVVRSDSNPTQEEEEEEEEVVDAILSKQGSGSFLLEDPEAEAHAAVAAAHAHAHGHTGPAAAANGVGGAPRPPLIMMARSTASEGDLAAAGAHHAAADGVVVVHHLPFLRMLKVLGSPGAAVFLVFAVTLAVFPSLTVHVVSTARCKGKGAFYDKGFVPFQFLLFNLCDFLGRTLAGAGNIVPSSRLWLWSLARTAFVPLFLLCNVEGSALPTLFPSDWWPTLFMLAFATSNGYLSSLAMMAGPQQLGPHAAPDLAEAAGVTMVLLMTMGLGAGSGLSFLVLALSQGGFH